MTAAATRVLVLAIDAASPALLTRWADDGSMPNLKALMARGQVGTTHTMDGIYVAATWPSLYTSLNPGAHGFHYLVQLRPGSYDYEIARPKGPAFWEHLHRAGKRTALIDVPLSVVDPGATGIHIVDWSGIERTFGYDTVPAGLKQEIASRWGSYPLEHACDGLRRGAAEFGVLVDKLEAGIARRTAMSTDFLSRGGWDFFMQVFTEAHCAGHQCWHLHDPAHPAHDPDVVREIGDPLRRVYTAIDRAIGQTVAAAGDTTVLLFSAHGMSFWYGAQVLLPDILFRLGVSVPLAGPSERAGLAASLRGQARRVWRRLPRRLRDTLIPPPPRLRAATAGFTLPALGVDTFRSRCFMVRNGNISGGIRLNLKGREPSGVLSPGAEAEAFLRELTQDLLDLVDERTGRPVVRRVLRTSEEYQGARLSELPDLLVDWAFDVPTGSSHHGGGAAATVAVRSPKFGRLEATNDYTRTGDHRIEGMFVAAGPGVRPGRVDRVVSILDLAPTFTALAGVDMPGAEGKPIPEVVGD